MKTPATERPAMIVVVKGAFEAFSDVYHVDETRSLKRFPGIA